jgi:aspartokinase
MRSYSGVAAKAFGMSAGEGINIMGIGTSEMKISGIIGANYH